MKTVWFRYSEYRDTYGWASSCWLIQIWLRSAEQTIARYALPDRCHGNLNEIPGFLMNAVGTSAGWELLTSWELNNSLRLCMPVCIWLVDRSSRSNSLRSPACTTRASREIVSKNSIENEKNERIIFIDFGTVFFLAKM